MNELFSRLSSEIDFFCMKSELKRDSCSFFFLEARAPWFFLFPNKFVRTHDIVVQLRVSCLNHRHHYRRHRHLLETGWAWQWEGYVGHETFLDAKLKSIQGLIVVMKA